MKETMVYPTVEKPKNKLLLPLIIFLVLAIIGIIASTYFWYAPVTRYIDGLKVVRQLPEPLKNAYFYTANPNTPGYVVDGEALARAEFSEHIDPLKPRVSPNGTTQVYAKPAPMGGSLVQDGVVSVDFSKWFIYVAKDNEEPRLIANGYAPTFLSDTHIGYFSNSGYVVLDLEAGQYKLLNRRPAEARLGTEVQISPNNQYLLWVDAVTGGKYVVKLSHDTYETLYIYQEKAVLALTDSTVYELFIVPQGTAIFDRGFKGEKRDRVVTFPRSLAIKGFIL